MPDFQLNRSQRFFVFFCIFCFSWSSNTIWGVCCEGVTLTSFQPSEFIPQEDARVVLSSSESKLVQTALSAKYRLVFASGAGYKILATALGLANAYVLSHRSIYRWDCCALHAILLALGGGIVSYKHALEAANQSESPLLENDLTQLQVHYTRAAGAISSRRASISGGCESLPGIIAYRSTADVLFILDLLKS